MIKSTACTGGEVRAELHLLVTYYRATGRVSVRGDYGGLQLYEGTSCSTTDLDGVEFAYSGLVSIGQPVPLHTSVGNYAEGGNDRATVSGTLARVS